MVNRLAFERGVWLCCGRRDSECWNDRERRRRRRRIKEPRRTRARARRQTSAMRREVMVGDIEEEELVSRERRVLN